MAQWSPSPLLAPSHTHSTGPLGCPRPLTWAGSLEAGLSPVLRARAALQREETRWSAVAAPADTSCHTAPMGSRCPRPHSPALPWPTQSQASHHTLGREWGQGPSALGSTMALPLAPPARHPHQLETDTEAIRAGVFWAQNPCPVGPSWGCHPSEGKSRESSQVGSEATSPPPTASSASRKPSVHTTAPRILALGTVRKPVTELLRNSRGTEPQGKRPPHGGSWAEPVGTGSVLLCFCPPPPLPPSP